MVATRLLEDESQVIQATGHLFLRLFVKLAELGELTNFASILMFVDVGQKFSFRKA
jgi:hypothetical protein